MQKIFSIERNVSCKKSGPVAIQSNFTAYINLTIFGFEIYEQEVWLPDALAVTERTFIRDICVQVCCARHGTLSPTFKAPVTVITCGEGLMLMSLDLHLLQ